MTEPDLAYDTAAKEGAFARCGPLGRGIAVVDCDHLTLSLRQGPYFLLTVVWILMTLLIALLPLLSVMMLIASLPLKPLGVPVATVMLIFSGLVTLLAAFSIVRAAMPRRIVVDRSQGVVNYCPFPWSRYTRPIKSVEHVALAHSHDRKLVYLNLIGTDSLGLSTFRFREADISFSSAAAFAAFQRTAELLADYLERPLKLVEVPQSYIWSARPWY